MYHNQLAVTLYDASSTHSTYVLFTNIAWKLIGDNPINILDIWWTCEENNSNMTHCDWISRAEWMCLPVDSVLHPNYIDEEHW